MPEKEMTMLERQIYEVIRSKLFLKDNIGMILESINESYKRIQDKGKSQGLTIDPQVKKEILGKCMYETVNRHIAEYLKPKLLKEEQSYSVQPLLLAHPSHLKTLKDLPNKTR